MENPPRRKRFQIHLSTAIVLMFAAGGLIWANVEGELEYGICNMGLCVNEIKFGCPIRSLTETQFFEQTADVYNPTITYSPDYMYISIDFSIALVILFVIWFVCEWWIGHRAAKSGA